MFFRLNNFELAGIIAAGCLLTAGLLIAPSDSQPLSLMTQAEADRECGGTAIYNARVEETGDGGKAVVEIYRCPDGKEILAKR